MSDPSLDAPAPESTYLSTTQVSEALGVGVSTVKRWVDEGVLPAHKTAGGHRKLLLADVVRLSRERKLPLADLALLVPAPARRPSVSGDFSGQMLKAVRGPDAEAIRSLVLGAYHAGLSVPAIADRVLAPALRKVGDDWAAGKVDVMHEHQVSQACISALYELRAVLVRNAKPDRPLAVGGTPEFDHTVASTLLAELTMLDAGWNAVNLGPHTPASAFRRALEDLDPRLLWVSVNHLEDEDHFLEQYRETYAVAEERGIPVAVGGRALTESLRREMPYTTYGDGLAQLAAFARTLNPRPRKKSNAGRPLGGGGGPAKPTGGPASGGGRTRR